MRRTELEIKELSAIKNIIKKAEVCYLGLAEGNKPYVIPMSYGYVDKENILYLHGAKQGKKIDILKKNNQISFAISIDHKLELSDEIAHSTVRYRSVVGSGRAYFIEEKEEKIIALNSIMKHYTHRENDYDYGKVLDVVQIIKIEIESLTGKTNYPKKTKL